MAERKRSKRRAQDPAVNFENMSKRRKRLQEAIERVQKKLEKVEAAMLQHPIQKAHDVAEWLSDLYYDSNTKLPPDFRKTVEGHISETKLVDDDSEREYRSQVRSYVFDGKRVAVEAVYGNGHYDEPCIRKVTVEGEELSEEAVAKMVIDKEYAKLPTHLWPAQRAIELFDFFDP